MTGSSYLESRYGDSVAQRNQALVEPSKPRCIVPRKYSSCSCNLRSPSPSRCRIARIDRTVPPRIRSARIVPPRIRGSRRSHRNA